MSAAPAGVERRRARPTLNRQIAHRLLLSRDPSLDIRDARQPVRLVGRIRSARGNQARYRRLGRPERSIQVAPRHRRIDTAELTPCSRPTSPTPTARRLRGLRLRRRRRIRTTLPSRMVSSSQPGDPTRSPLPCSSAYLGRLEPEPHRPRANDLLGRIRGVLEAAATPPAAARLRHGPAKTFRRGAGSTRPRDGTTPRLGIATRSRLFPYSWHEE